MHQKPLLEERFLCERGLYHTVDLATLGTFKLSNPLRT